VQVGEERSTFIGDKIMIICEHCGCTLKVSVTGICICPKCFEKHEQDKDQPELTRYPGYGEKMKDMWILYVDSVDHECCVCDQVLKAGNSYHLKISTALMLCQNCYEKQQQDKDQPELTQCSGCSEKMKIIRTLVRLLSEILEVENVGK